MYNRYIPAAGGGYVCHPIAELPELHPPEAVPRREPDSGGPGENCPPRDHRRDPAPSSREDRPCGSGVHPSDGPHRGKGLGFLEKLLPRDLEADDLLILLILLLLMMDNDGDDDSLTVLLAVAAFLILR